MHNGENPFEHIVPFLIYLPLGAVLIALIIFLVIMLRRTAKEAAAETVVGSTIGATVFKSGHAKNATRILCPMTRNIPMHRRRSTTSHLKRGTVSALSFRWIPRPISGSPRAMSAR